MYNHHNIKMIKMNKIILPLKFIEKILKIKINILKKTHKKINSNNFKQKKIKKSKMIFISKIIYQYHHNPQKTIKFTKFNL